MDHLFAERETSVRPDALKNRGMRRPSHAPSGRIGTDLANPIRRRLYSSSLIRTNSHNADSFLQRKKKNISNEYLIYLSSLRSDKKLIEVTKNLNPAANVIYNYIVKYNYISLEDTDFDHQLTYLNLINDLCQMLLDLLRISADPPLYLEECKGVSGRNSVIINGLTSAIRLEMDAVRCQMRSKSRDSNVGDCGIGSRRDEELKLPPDNSKKIKTTSKELLNQYAGSSDPLKPLEMRNESRSRSSRNLSRISNYPPKDNSTRLDSQSLESHKIAQMGSQGVFQNPLSIFSRVKHVPKKVSFVVDRQMHSKSIDYNIGDSSSEPKSYEEQKQIAPKDNLKSNAAKSQLLDESNGKLRLTGVSESQNEAELYSSFNLPPRESKSIRYLAALSPDERSRKLKNETLMHYLIPNTAKFSRRNRFKSIRPSLFKRNDDDEGK